MFEAVAFLNFILIIVQFVGKSESSDLDIGFVSSLKNDANLDLSIDEEYEDLRAELLAYQTALSSLTRRSLLSTPCWNLGGICVNYKLCTGFRFLTEVPGCKDKLKVCCFAWNQFKVRDMTDQGINTMALPWNRHQEFGGKGVISAGEGSRAKKQKKRNKIKKSKSNETKEVRKSLALIIDDDE